jgi:hypothetical protein
MKEVSTFQKFPWLTSCIIDLPSVMVLQQALSIWWAFSFPFPWVFHLWGVEIRLKCCQNPLRRHLERQKCKLFFECCIFEHGIWFLNNWLITCKLLYFHFLFDILNLISCLSHACFILNIDSLLTWPQAGHSLTVEVTWMASAESQEATAVPLWAALE